MDLATALRDQTAALAAAAVDPDAPVPTCPEWRVRDLVAHVGQAHRRAAGIVRTGQFTQEPPAEPGPPAEWARWLADGAEDLIAAENPRDVWTFFGPRPAAFWLRRMVADTTVHHADAVLAAGGVPEVAADLAAEAIAECLDLLSDPAVTTVRPNLAELRGTGQTLHLKPTTTTGWLITRTPDGVTFDRADGEADVTATAPTADLLWLLYRRLPVDDPRVTVTGDRALLDHWLALTVF
ncbi:maleylpyruvate isomerase family mycothiol-dependent enzyme [Actinokineospora auranticolor]|uniref:Uncharacterized protein (TIGR03083 family) n=1 Tax=Actinokineospora auranticolor TaxID=155976 RepID=A0A2S6H1C0_9PSEU|nr:maleylpyruvate isomerase family mycothiol-dependent enzyme [Actinokineospora auranticolor]PPK71288.1 uncharacterized protein (TIGR03083 family) [Actinokineospora auranticolor]